MSQPVFFLAAAEAELLRAQAWYDERVPGLGERFFDAVDTIVARISETPQQFPLAHPHIRRALVRRFPFALYFRIEREGAFVIACVHTSRAAEQWRSRL